MKGIIMAGGEGTRLRPLTCDCPKPMIRLMDKPVMQYALELLRRHGITEVAATLGYLPDVITDAFGDGGDLGIHLEYFIERTPLGTAGGVRQARSFLDETFVVLSGDAVTDLDIARAAAFHRERGALATLVLKRVEEPLEYGVVDVDPRGRVLGFHEKPDWADVTSDTVNTGIYILEPEVLDEIPEGRPCDFGRELFPRLVAEGRPVYGYVTQDYWCDVGDVRAYLAAHIDAMEGRIRLDGLPALGGRAVQLPGAIVDRAAVLEGPCLIEAGARVAAGAYVGPYSVVASDCAIGEGASVKRSVLWPGARLAARAQARGCVLAAGAALGEGAQAYEECVLGTRAVMEARSTALPGVRLWPGKRAAEGERLDANRVWGGRRTPGFAAGSLGAASPAEVSRAAQACMAALSPREVVLGHDGRPAAQALWHAAAAGAMAQGVQVIDAGACSLAVLRHTLLAHWADAALFVEEDALTPLNRLGVWLPGKVQRSIAQLITRQDYPVPAPERALSVLDATSAGAAYVAEVATRFTAVPDRAATVALACEGPLVRDLAERAFRRAGLTVRAVPDPESARLSPGELGLQLSPDGERCRLSDVYGTLTDAQQQLMAAWTALEAGEHSLLLPTSATRGIDALAARYEAQVEYIAGERARWANALADRSPRQLELYCDGLLLAISAMSLLADKALTLAEWRQAMPEVHRRSRTLPLPTRRNGQVLQAFARSQPDAALGGGVRLQRENGWAWVGADEGHPRLRIVAEGDSAEFAGELCDFCETTLRRLCSESEPTDARNDA